MVSMKAGAANRLVEQALGILVSPVVRVVICQAWWLEVQLQDRRDLSHPGVSPAEMFAAAPTRMEAL